jgi:hypothetical protein
MPHLIVLDDVLCHKYILSEKMDFIMGVLFALSYINANMYVFLVFAYLLMIIYNKLHIRGYIATAVFITLSWLILHLSNIYANISQSDMFQTMIIIGVGMLCFFGFLFSDEDVKSPSG